MNTIDQLEQAAIDAGLAHELAWSQVCRILACLPVEGGCRWCGCDLDRWAESAWRCRSCGRIDTWERKS